VPSLLPLTTLHITRAPVFVLYAASKFEANREKTDYPERMESRIEAASVGVRSTLFHTFGALAEFEREIIRERTKVIAGGYAGIVLALSDWYTSAAGLINRTFGRFAPGLTAWGRELKRVLLGSPAHTLPLLTQLSGSITTI
jgi:hypothetical protein